MFRNDAYRESQPKKIAEIFPEKSSIQESREAKIDIGKRRTFTGWSV